MKPKKLHFTGPTVWRGCDIARTDAWIVNLTAKQNDELVSLVQRLAPRGTSLEEIAPAAANLPVLVPTIREIASALSRGRGFSLLRGLAVERYTPDELMVALWVIGTHLGVGVSQNFKGERVGHVRDIGQSDRYYTVGGPLEMHMDPVDVVALMCVRKAAEGGQSRITSAPAVHNCIAREYPNHLSRLYEGFFCTSRRADRLDGAPPFSPQRVPVFADCDGSPQSFLLPLAVRNTEVEGYRLTDEERECLAVLAEVGQREEMSLSMDLEPGDVQFLNNRVVFHGRADYVDHGEADQRRHMLRLWLMMPDWPNRHPRMNMHAHPDRGVGGIAPRA